MLADAVNAFSRRVILAASESEAIRGFARRHGMRLGAPRFVAGETFDDAVVVLRRLNERGLRDEHDAARRGRRRARPRRAASSRRTSDDPRPHRRARGCGSTSRSSSTHLGLALRRGARAREHRASSSRMPPAHGNFMRLDMEESALRRRDAARVPSPARGGPRNVGTVLQSYLYRTPATSRALLDLEPNLRFVKGAYLEPPEVAYPEKSDVDAAYARLIERSLLRPADSRRSRPTTSADRPRDVVRRGRRHPERRASSSRCSTASARKLQLDLVRRGLRRARRDALRAGLVPLSDAPPGRAAGERALPRCVTSCDDRRYGGRAREPHRARP